jgi:serine protease inhibitor
MSLTRTRPRRLRAVTPAVLAALLVAACATDRLVAPLDPLEPQRALTADERVVAGSSMAFGLRLLQQLHAGEAEANLLLSPLSASMALGMALSGARGETYDAMRAALGLSSLSDAAIHEAYAGLFGQLRGRDARVEIGLANSAWYERTFAVLPDYLERARRYFRAEVQPLDFFDPASPATINEWVERQTEGRIRELIDAIDPLDRLILVNAVYFKAPWTVPFEPQATQRAPFTTLDGRRVDVDMMMQDRQYRWFRDDDAFGVELLYADSVFSMVVLAPTDPRGLDAFIADLSAERLAGHVDRMQPGRIMLRMPKFRFEYGTSLKDALAALGMGIAFEPRVADFQRIAPVDDLHISRVQQNTFIDVHELGTEAAAATSVVVSVTSLPPEVVFDRPFVVAIRERDSGTLLFLGRIGDPSR